VGPASWGRRWLCSVRREWLEGGGLQVKERDKEVRGRREGIGEGEEG
jgi:hypothetical protein